MRIWTFVLFCAAILLFGVGDVFAHTGSTNGVVITWEDIQSALEEWNEAPSISSLLRAFSLIEKDLKSKGSFERESLYSTYRNMISVRLTMEDASYDVKRWRIKLANLATVLYNDKGRFGVFLQKLALDEVLEFIISLKPGVFDKNSKGFNEYEISIVELPPDEKNITNLDPVRFRTVRKRAFKVAAWILGNFIERGKVRDISAAEDLKRRALFGLALAGDVKGCLWVGRNGRIKAAHLLLIPEKQAVSKLIKLTSSKPVDLRAGILLSALKAAYGFCSNLSPLDVDFEMYCESSIRDRLALSLKSLAQSLPSESGWKEVRSVALAGSGVLSGSGCRSLPKGSVLPMGFMDWVFKVRPEAVPSCSAFKVEYKNKNKVTTSPRS